MRKMNFQDIRSQQVEVANLTHNEWPGIFDQIDIGISSMISALYETSKFPDPIYAAGRVQSAAWLWTYQSVYALSVSIHLAEVGFYTETFPLNRSLMETLVQIHYLERHPSEIDNLPKLSSGSGRKLKFSTMFEEIVPGYYAKYYKWASEFAHPGLGSNAFRMTRDNSGQGRLDQGVVYNSDRFTSSFNEFVILILGFLRILAILFPTSRWETNAFLKWKEGVISMQAVVDSHIVLKHGPNDWHKLTEPLWGPRDFDGSI
jgi:hypothetical protein